MYQRSSIRLLAGLSIAALIVVLGIATFRSDTSPVAYAVSAEDCGIISCTASLPVIFSLYPPPSNLEVTQGVQQPDNSVTLIANRKTYVRYTVTSTLTVNNVDALLYGTLNGGALPGSPLSPENGPLTIDSSADRAALNDSFYFELPASWANGTITLYGTASDGASFSISSGQSSFSFVNADPLNVTIVRVAYTCNSGGSGTISPGGSPHTYLTNYTYQTYPVPSINSGVRGGTMAYSGPCFSNVPDPTGNDWEDMLDDVSLVWLLDGAPDSYYYALVEVYCGGGCIAGIGWIGTTKAAVGFNGFGASHSAADETHAHEVGHNHGRQHAPGCGASGTDPSFPYTSGGKGYIGNTTKQNFGFNIDSPAVYPATTYIDFMSYCNPTWVSDYTYEAIRSYAASHHMQPSITQPDDRALLISGDINAQSGAVQFKPAYALDMPARLPRPGDHTIELLDAQGNVLAAYAFEPVDKVADRYQQGTAFESSGFQMALPYVDGIEALRVRRGDRQLGELRRSANAPTFAAADGAASFDAVASHLSWSARHSDGAALSYLVRISTDNGDTWNAIAVHRTTPAIDLLREDFAGQSVLVQVIASDGLNNTTELLGPFDISIDR